VEAGNSAIVIHANLPQISGGQKEFFLKENADKSCYYDLPVLFAVKRLFEQARVEELIPDD